jgi:hypothetical protein
MSRRHIWATWRTIAKCIETADIMNKPASTPNISGSATAKTAEGVAHAHLASLWFISSSIPRRRGSEVSRTRTKAASSIICSCPANAQRGLHMYEESGVSR